MKDYAGGTVWDNYEEAKRNCPSDYSVYGVNADWNLDTAKSNDGSYHDLLKDRDLIKVDTLCGKIWYSDDPWVINDIMEAFDRITNFPLVPNTIYLDEETYNDIKAFANETTGF